MTLEQRHFVYKLIPPRPTFDVDASDEEQAIMARHVGYWQRLMDSGSVVIFGGVSASSGAWGLGVIKAEHEEELHDIAAEDPAVKSGLCTYEVGTMPAAVVPGRTEVLAGFAEDPNRKEDT
jgi:uncharacterized protein YciI